MDMTLLMCCQGADDEVPEFESFPLDIET